MRVKRFVFVRDVCFDVLLFVFIVYTPYISTLIANAVPQLDGDKFRTPEV